MIDLSTWNLTVPATSSNTLITTDRLNNGYESQYFRRNSDGSISFWVPVNGSRTEDASYPRTELRETQADGTLSYWYQASADNYLSAVLSVDQVPSQNKIVIGQIHSKDEPGSQNDPLLKIQYHYLRGNGRIEALLRKRPGDAEVENIVLAENVDLGERFGYDLRLTPTGRLGIVVTSKGDDGNLYRQLSGYWSNQQLYFKAGAYIQDNYGATNEGGRVTFYWLNGLHR
ncbi:polysaccharide lyase family 7 protein [Pseudomonas sp. JS3066]|uniref:polysaccharide lyase family 7 protein n=1 Tax=unclassified Pseudomonas TaxID=196821 RepID=UPI000EA9E65D|nr:MULTISPECIES: polysaccharide lyase family 7 protein [unclassified Pseudomonas]AYF86156.1 polysaccharide lyase family 7 protein [Pseudomonas sp. DY-1]MDH4654195.1 polysaccharide lyase family 7 protein [Pseudomonas sp. BN606]MRK19319.1 polysaccharide lyase family 7 protein [Pseudomonas sp. JG-B]WVK91255.1 polysaccharide lyase family 7 protein [Pseudomonas sp. JS3066]